MVISKYAVLSLGWNFEAQLPFRSSVLLHFLSIHIPWIIYPKVLEFPDLCLFSSHGISVWRPINLRWLVWMTLEREHAANIPPTAPCTSSSSVSPTLGSGLACFPRVRSSSVSCRPPAVQSGNASLLLISGVVVPLVFPRLAPPILQLAPAGCFQPQPLFLCVPCSGPRSLVCSTEYYVWCSAPF